MAKKSKGWNFLEWGFGDSSKERSPELQGQIDKFQKVYPKFEKAFEKLARDFDDPNISGNIPYIDKDNDEGPTREQLRNMQMMQDAYDAGRNNHLPPQSLKDFKKRL